MSWASRAINFVLNSATGKPADAQIVLHPSSPVENLVNVAAGIILPAAAAVPGVQAAAVPLAALKQVVNDNANTAPAQALNNVVTAIGQQAKLQVADFLTNKIGASNAGLVDAGAEALAAMAIGNMSASSNKTEQEIAEFLHEALSGFLGTPPSPAVALAQSAA